jgi:hypothetical protein
MAKLWEDTVITVMRDEKWQHALRHGNGVPLPQLKLKGGAEQRLGDTLDLAPNDKFFLFEVKGTREDIRDEWHTGDKANHNRKHALRAHIAWFGALTMGVAEASAQANLELSRRGHFFVYWAEYGNGPAPAFEPNKLDEYLRAQYGFYDGVVVEPYLAACREMGIKELRGLYGDQSRLALMSDEPTVGFHRAQVPLSLVYEGRAGIVSPTSKMLEHEWEALGLSQEEMCAYLRALCSAEGSATSEPIHAVVMSASGQFFRVMTQTAQLEELLLPSPTITAPVPPPQESPIALARSPVPPRTAGRPGSGPKPPGPR